MASGEDGDSRNPTLRLLGTIVIAVHRVIESLAVFEIATQLYIHRASETTRPTPIKPR